MYIDVLACYLHVHTCICIYISHVLYTCIHVYHLQVLAQGIYDELQGLMDAYGQEGIANLMPLVVNVLENLDSAMADNQVCVCVSVCVRE